MFCGPLANLKTLNSSRISVTLLFAIRPSLDLKAWSSVYGKADQHYLGLVRNTNFWAKVKVLGMWPSDHVVIRA